MPSKVLMFGLALAFAVPASAQTKVWTAADLGKPMRLDRIKITDAELTGLTAHQFKYIPPLPDGPTVIILGADGPTLGPWPFSPFPAARRLDGTPLDSPPTVYGNPFIWAPLSRRHR